MNERAIFNWLIIAWFILAAAVFIALFFITAPYGRHSRRGLGPAIGNRLGWIIMEAASPLMFAVCFVSGTSARTLPILVFLGLWEMHYVYRSFIFPFSLRGNSRRIPLMIVGSGLLFNLVNGYVNGRYLFSLSGGYAGDWLRDPRFTAGVVIFIVGFVINNRSDRILHNLRRPGESGYRIPYGGLYRWISCPNYLGEVMIWTGWALATWSLPAAAFAAWTIANLVPRARSHHAWYRANFPDYPPERRILLPSLW